MNRCRSARIMAGAWPICWIKWSALLPPQPPARETQVAGIKVAIVGRPHVGKSLLLNKLLGKERSIVGDNAGHHPGCH